MPTRIQDVSWSSDGDKCPYCSGQWLESRQEAEEFGETATFVFAGSREMSDCRRALLSAKFTARHIVHRVKNKTGNALAEIFRFT